MIICSQCVMDETVPDIYFNSKGICKYCLMYDDIKKINNKLVSKEIFLSKLENIKKKSKKYDCIAGVSGGRDSTFLLYTLKKKLNLNPLAVHYDNGWNTDLSNRNIKNVCLKLGIDLHTSVANWKSFSLVQRSLFFASVPDVDTITELGIYKSLFEAASLYNCEYIMTGHNIDNEFMDPLKWTYFDGRYINSICQEQGASDAIKKISIFYLKYLIKYKLIKKIKIENVTNYFDYDHGTIAETLIKECDWTPYEGHHQESLVTKFLHEYYLPMKFKIDKRKTNYSARIRSNLMTRNDALENLKINTYEKFDKNSIDFVLKKLNITSQEFENIMNKKNKNFLDYKSYYPYFSFFSPIIKIMCRLNLLNPYLYHKYKM